MRGASTMAISSATRNHDERTRTSTPRIEPTRRVPGGYGATASPTPRVRG